MQSTLNVQRKGDLLEVKGTLPTGTKEIEVRLESSRNHMISKFTDRSHNDINQTDRYLSGPKVPIPDREIWWPIVDVHPTDKMQAVASFKTTKDERGQYCVNGMFHDQEYRLENRITIGHEQLEHWENAIYVSGSIATMTGFYLSQKVNLNQEELFCEFSLLSKDWSGRISLYPVNDNENNEALAAFDVQPERLEDINAIPTQQQNLSKEKNALMETIKYILRSQNLNEASPAYGGLNLFYDHDARTFRQNVWIWPWGPAIRLLIDASHLPEAAVRFGKETLIDAALRMGEATLRFQVKTEGHPGEGLIICRFDPNTKFENGGYTGFISPADTLFLARWGWAPLYEHTGDPRYLEAMKSAVSATERIIQDDVMIKQDYLTKEQYWVDHTLDESGFGMEGISELYRLTGDESYKTIGKQYIGQMIAGLERSDGLWDRDWNRANHGPSPTNCNTRGMGWAMEGLQASHRLLPDGPYLQKAELMADHLLRHQLDSGCWSFEFDKSPEFLGVAEKGTALWSMLLYHFAATTGQIKYKHAARKALDWCIEQQYQGPDADGKGGIIGCSPASGVIYRPFYKLSCVYTSAFMGLAILEDLKED